MAEFHEGAFYFIAVAVVGCAIGMVAFKNLIHSAISMVCCFIGVAGLYILLHAELLAAAQVLIYVGAISILIIFAIMLTRHRTGDIRIFFHRQSWIAIPIVATVAVILTAVLASSDFNTTEAGANPSTEEVSHIIFDQYAFPFEVASLVLLVAMVGAVLLASKERKQRKRKRL